MDDPTSAQCSSAEENVPDAEISPESFGSIMTTTDLGAIRSSCFIPGGLGVYEEAMKVGLRFPLHPFVVMLLDRYALSLAQIAQTLGVIL